jgi:hypothetical protein
MFGSENEMVKKWFKKRQMGAGQKGKGIVDTQSSNAFLDRRVGRERKGEESEEGKVRGAMWQAVSHVWDRSGPYYYKVGTLKIPCFTKDTQY